MIDAKMMRRLRRKLWAMKNRCTNPKHESWPNYGGRGISVCERWTGPDGFYNFVRDVGMPPDYTMSLDRVDNDGDYEPGNVRWATQTQQIRNRRRDGNYGKRGLDAGDVLRILADIEAGVPYLVIAAEWDITPFMVSHIATGRCWGSVTGRMCRTSVVC